MIYFIHSFHYSKVRHYFYISNKLWGLKSLAFGDFVIMNMYVIFKHVLMIDMFGNYCEITGIFMLQGNNDDMYT